MDQVRSVDYAGVKPRWRKRFEFFDAHGAPGGRPFQEAVRQKSFGERAFWNWNMVAFIFGPFYFLVLGMWRKALTMLGIGAAVVALLSVVDFAIRSGGLPEFVWRVVPFAMAALYAVSADYTYYLHVTRNPQSWNPFEGIFRT